jgi:uncharacterized protein YjbI with pentapeptide repeats
MNILHNSALSYLSNAGTSSLTSLNSSLKLNGRDTAANRTVATDNANETGVIKRTDYRNANLHGIDLSGQDLSGFDFTGADLHGANLTNAKLTGANFSRADLHGATLNGADLSGANMQSSNFHGAELTNANLTASNINGADFHGSNFQGADFRQAQIGNADLHGSDLTNANTTDVDFSAANMRGVIGYGQATQTASLTLNSLTTERKNLKDASSTITASTDELSKLTKLNPAVESQLKRVEIAYGTSALTQANSASQTVLSLLK